MMLCCDDLLLLSIAVSHNTVERISSKCHTRSGISGSCPANDE